MRDTLEHIETPALERIELDSQATVFRFRAMASPCEVCVEGLSSLAAEVAAQKAANEVARIEAKYSRYRSDSIVSRINAAAGGDWIAIDDETRSLLEFAQSLARESEGLFDITSGVLRRVWDFRAGKLPEESSLSETLALIGTERILLDGSNVRLADALMEIDLGGFGKEYAADRAAAVLAAEGVRHGFVNLGGDLRALGPKQSGEPWSIGIAHPREPENTIASISLRTGALATSGDYERFFEHDGQRYCHILNPKTGRPVTHWQSISVLAPVCAAAGALATIAMLREAHALEFLDAQGCGYLAIRFDGERFAR
ncbi:MAG: FAD:protein FMN transferase [Burkholderiales bacterium]|nr:MAG: FAD:protein FMN transferase [Burkholderiales bacterium]